MSQARDAGIDRRDLIVGVTSVAAAAAALGASPEARAQSVAPAAAPGPLAPTNAIVVERLPNGVLTIGIDRPPRNIVGPSMLVAIGKALYQLEHDDGLRVGVLYAKGPDFTHGLDRPAYGAALRAGQYPPTDPEFVGAANLRPPIRTKPLVIAVQGATRTLGHELMLAADIRVAASDTVFSQQEVTEGAFPIGGATIRFTREAGWANAMRYILTGDPWGAEEAFRLGLVQAMTPPGQQLAKALEFAAKIARAAPLGVRAAMASAHQALASEDAAFAGIGPAALKIGQSADFQEYYAAQREHRTPAYAGR